MATRGLYKFYSNTEELEADKPNACVYRHWDNYLSEGGVDLVEFIQTLKEAEFDNRIYDSTYFAAKYVVYLAREFASDWDKEPLDFLSVGIVHPEADWGAEYIYHIISETDEEGFPKIFVDSYDLDKENIWDAFKKEGI